MAEVLKERRLVNSGKRRRNIAAGFFDDSGFHPIRASYDYKKAKVGEKVKTRRRKNSGARKRMTAKQIKFFGTARQRAGLRRRRTSNAGKYTSIRGTKKMFRKAKLGVKGGWKAFAKRKRKNSGLWKRAKKFVTGRSRKRRLTSHKIVRRAKNGRRKNVGQIFSIGLLGGNPGRKKRSKTVMARRRRRSKARVGNPTRRRRTRTRVYHRRRSRARVGNPVRRRRHARSYGRRRRRIGNPGGASIGGMTNLFKSAVSVIGGAVASRYATQLALGAKNQGIMGYAGNAIAALLLGWGAKRFLGPNVGAMVTLGGFTGLALRMLSDLTPIGQYVNLQLNGMGKAGDTGIGLITDSTFYVPTTFASGSMNQAQVPAQLQAMIAAAGGSKGMAGLGGRRRTARGV